MVDSSLWHDRIPCFAYGRNLNKERMARRCHEPIASSKAVLHDWRFIINRRGVASVVQDSGSRVEGFLWALTEADIEKLDGCEGVPASYRKEHLDVSLTDGGTVRALVYVATSSDSGSPREGYLEEIIQCARSLGFSPEYVTHLESLRS